MYKYLFVFMHVLVITVLIKRKMAAMFSAERANQKKKANACLISHIEKK